MPLALLLQEVEILLTVCCLRCYKPSTGLMLEGLPSHQKMIHCGGPGYQMIVSCLIQKLLGTVNFSLIHLNSNLEEPQNMMPQALSIRLQKN
ncbi:Uncharacterized protein TCM_000706 [Theobroma cacao]|uniref:Uncharacterized protein n=1 Tax=Theobroma cacao TaxID=3641 RepID=A0A061DGN5_THECC|nr:Uncharacterized protein TCM_000706 [Theobroma cacao]